MSLSWFRIDTSIGMNDKVVALLAERDGAKAFSMWVFSLAYAVGTDTDGLVRRHMLPMLHGNEKLADLLVKHRMWDRLADDSGDYVIHNYAKRQQSALETEVTRAAQRRAARKTNCIKKHGADCGCWEVSDAA